MYVGLSISCGRLTEYVRTFDEELMEILVFGGGHRIRSPHFCWSKYNIRTPDKMCLYVCTFSGKFEKEWTLQYMHVVRSVNIEDETYIHPLQVSLKLSILPPSNCDPSG